MSVLKNLIGFSVTEAEVVQDYIQIVFADVAGLTIFNRYQLEGGSLSSLIGQTLETAEDDGRSVVLEFDGDMTLRVGLGDDDYEGPEAMTLFRTGEPLVVWN